MFKTTPITLPLKMLLFALVIFMVCRSALWAMYPDYFSNISIVSAAKAYWLGMRFDLAITTLALTPILLVLLLPFQWLQTVWLRQTLAWIGLVLLVILAGIYMGDIVYFGEVNRHIGHELLLLNQDYRALLDIAFRSRLPVTLTALGLLLVLIIAWYLWLVRPLAKQTVHIPKAFWQKVLFYLVAVVFFVWLGRGLVVQSKPIDTLDAFRDARPETANLALNGAFVVLKDATRDRQKPLKMLSDETFGSLSEKYMAIDSEPFQWQATDNIANQRNIVFILLESWSYKYIDALAGNNYGATPFIDSLITKSQVWHQFYAAGQRSLNGIQAVLTSVPVLPTQPALGYGLELNNMSRLGQIFKDAGYQTLMVQSSNRRSFHLDGIAKSLGFEQYYGKEDIPLIRDYPQDTPSYGWDYDTLMFMENKLSNMAANNKPFFSFVFTGTTHEPFANPGEEFLIYPHDPLSEQGFLNTLRYSDWSLEQFFAKASQQPWFNNTTFVITADHVLRADNETLAGQFHIPLIVYTPDKHLSPTQHYDVASQYDLLPSLVDLAGLTTPVYTFGTSLFDSVRPPYKYAKVSKGLLTGLIAPSGSALLSENAVIEEKTTNPQVMTTKLEYLKWRLQLADQRLRDNHWHPGLN
ncbi:MAG: LTA synthase family protein [Methylophaga sp.]